MQDEFEVSDGMEEFTVTVEVSGMTIDDPQDADVIILSVTQFCEGPEGANWDEEVSVDTVDHILDKIRAIAIERAAEQKDAEAEPDPDAQRDEWLDAQFEGLS